MIEKAIREMHSRQIKALCEIKKDTLALIKEEKKRRKRADKFYGHNKRTDKCK